MNYSKLTQAIRPLNEVRKLKLPYAKAKQVYKLFKVFESEFSFFQQEEAKLIETYALKGEDGKPKMDAPGIITFENIEDKNAYLGEMEKLSTAEVDIEIPRIVLTEEDIGNQIVTPEMLEKLEEIIIFE